VECILPGRNTVPLCDLSIREPQEFSPAGAVGNQVRSRSQACP
jgi:hypothetical protein